MARIFVLLSVLLALAATGAWGWWITRPPLAVLVVPGATDIQLDTLKWNEWQIRYHVPGAQTHWYTDVAHQLEAQHWSILDRSEYGSLTKMYSRRVSFGFCELWEWAHLSFDPLRPNIAQIRVRRWIVFPRWQSLFPIPQPPR